MDAERSFLARVEAGFILIGVDYTSAEFNHLADERMNPYELGLGWAVKLKSGQAFLGREAAVLGSEEGGFG